MTQSVYCGAKDDAPRGRKLGTRSQCKRTRQIRRFGVFGRSCDTAASKEKVKELEKKLAELGKVVDMMEDELKEAQTITDDTKVAHQELVRVNRTLKNKLSDATRDIGKVEERASKLQEGLVSERDRAIAAERETTKAVATRELIASHNIRMSGLIDKLQANVTKLEKQIKDDAAARKKAKEVAAGLEDAAQLVIDGGDWAEHVADQMDALFEDGSVSAVADVELPKDTLVPDKEVRAVLREGLVEQQALEKHKDKSPSPPPPPVSASAVASGSARAVAAHADEVERAWIARFDDLTSKIEGQLLEKWKKAKTLPSLKTVTTAADNMSFPTARMREEWVSQVTSCVVATHAHRRDDRTAFINKSIKHFRVNDPKQWAKDTALRIHSLP